MSDAVYVAKSEIERRQGPIRIARLPGESQPVVFSIHRAIAEHYKVDPASLKEPHASTFGGALEARQIDASNGKLTAEVTGEGETEEGVLVIRRIHVAMRLRLVKKGSRRARPQHLRNALPSLPNLHRCIQLTSSFELAPLESQSGASS